MQDKKKTQGRSDEIMSKIMLCLQDSRYLYSIRHGFTLVMPVMIIGSIAVLMNNFPLPAYHSLAKAIFGENWKDFGSLAYAATFSIVSLVVSMSISYELTGWYRENRGAEARPILVMIVAFSSAMAMIATLHGQIDLSAMTGVNGLFLSIFISILATEVFIRLSRVYAKRAASVYAYEANESVTAALKAIVPSILTLALFISLRLIFHACGVSNLNDGLSSLMQTPFRKMENTPLTALVFSFITHFLWLFGIHGNDVLDNVAIDIYQAAGDANIAAAIAGIPPANIYTKTFFDAYVYMGGCGVTLCLIIAILLFARRNGVKRLARFSAPMALFNINEPMMYGLPIVLNPVYIVPFLATPLVMTLTTSAAMLFGLVPYPVANIDWTTPVFASGYAASGGSVSGVLIQAFNLTIGVCIYLPFVRLADRLEQRRFRATLAKLSARAAKNPNEPAKRLIGLDGAAGTAARQLANDLCSLLRGGVPGDELYLVYQPLIDTKEGRVFGYETLLRWKHPMHGHVSPMVTAALAEDAGEMKALGQWILDEGLRQFARYRARGFEHLEHFTNLSARQLSIANFHEQVEKLVKKHNVPPQYVHLEITESAVLSTDDVVNRNIEALNALGVRIALDDFGMGHSSLGYLEVFPAKTIKIEESLTENIREQGGVKLGIIKSIADMCENLNIELIAEHIETVEQLKLLQKVGCTKIQGYLFSEPLLPEAFEHYMKTMRIPSYGETQER